MDKTTQLHIVARALHTLECQPAYGSMAEDMKTLFLHHSYTELTALRIALEKEAGTHVADIGAHTIFETVEA